MCTAQCSCMSVQIEQSNTQKIGVYQYRGIYLPASVSRENPRTCVRLSEPHRRIEKAGYKYILHRSRLAHLNIMNTIDIHELFESEMLSVSCRSI